MRTVFLRALEADDKESMIRAALHSSTGTRSNQRFDVELSSLAAVPGSTFAYWAPARALQIFSSYDPLAKRERIVVSTNPLNNDFRYVRLAWEIGNHSETGRGQWRPWAKGGSQSPFYYDIDTVIIWDRLRSTYLGFLGTENRPLERPASVQHFFRPGLTWPRRTNGLSLRVLPTGCIFADKGPAVFVEKDSPSLLLALAAIINSRPFGYLVRMQLARIALAQTFEVGLMQQTPVPDINAEDQGILAGLTRQAWSLKRVSDTRAETSHAFTMPALLQVHGHSLAGRAATWAERVRATANELATIQAEIDERCFDLYGIGDADRRTITDGFGAPAAGVGDDTDAAPDTDAADAADAAEAAADAATLAAELVSWAVGAAFGRFDVRLATGNCSPPTEPGPFDTLPVCSPGMLTGDYGLPLVAAPSGYPLAFPDDSILVDDPGHPRDLAGSALAAFAAPFGSEFDTRWDEAAGLLDQRGRDLRAWLAKGFFDRHVRRYSKSHRKAPIYWQLSTPSASYSVWLYIQRATPDTLYAVLNEYVAPKLQHEERRLSGLIQEAGPTPSAGQRRDIAEQVAFVGELQVFRQEVARVAPLWAPDLNDGVIVNFAPLWRLVPQHGAWQKEVKACWDALCAGKYDWSHLAMRLWPERVVPRCIDDRSLAIAHDVEAEFWMEGAGGKWRRREISAGSVDRREGGPR